MDSIPVAYQAMVDKIYQLSWKGRIESNKARKVLRYVFRMPKEICSKIFSEMEEFKLIKFENCRYINVEK